MTTKELAGKFIKKYLPDYRIEWKTWQNVPAVVKPGLLTIHVEEDFLKMLSVPEMNALLGHEIAHVLAWKKSEEMGRDIRGDVEHGNTLFELYLIGMRNKHKYSIENEQSLQRKAKNFFGW